MHKAFSWEVIQWELLSGDSFQSYKIMLVDIAPRQAGKTTRMISWLVGNKDRVVITFSEGEKQRLQAIVTDLKFPEARDQIMTWQDATRHKGLLSQREVAVDNADKILQQELMAGRLERISITMHK